MLSASVDLAVIDRRTSANVILNDQSKRLQQGMFTHRLIWTDSAFRSEVQEIRIVFLEVPQECGGIMHTCAGGETSAHVINVCLSTEIHLTFLVSTLIFLSIIKE